MSSVYLNSNEYLPFSRLDKIYITLLASSGVGKTTFICAMDRVRDALSRGGGIELERDTKKSVGSMELITYDKNRNEYCEVVPLDNMWGNEVTTDVYMDTGNDYSPNTIYTSNFDRSMLKPLRSTDDTSVFTYKLKVRGEGTADEVEVSLLDYSGGNIGLGETYKCIRKRLQQSFVVIVPIDAVCVVEYVRQKRLGNEDKCFELIYQLGYKVMPHINDWLQNCFEAKANGVLFLVPVKCESFLDKGAGGEKELLEAVREVYFDLNSDGFETAPTVVDQFTKCYSDLQDKKTGREYRKFIRNHVKVFYIPVKTYGRVFLTGKGIDNLERFWQNGKFTPTFVTRKGVHGEVSGTLDIVKQIILERADALNTAIKAAKGLKYYLLHFGGHATFVKKHIQISDKLRKAVEQMKRPSFEEFQWPTDEELEAVKREVGSAEVDADKES